MSLHEASFEAVKSVPVTFEDMAVKDGAAVKHAKNKASSRKLLMALFYHHGTNANMSPPKGWKKREPKPVEAPKVTFRAEKDVAADIDPLKIEDIKREICEYFDITRMELVSPRRNVMSVRCRHIAMLMCKRFTGRSLPEIGRRLGGRDHSTILHGIRRIEELSKADWMIAYDVAHIEATLAKRFAQ